MSRPSVYLAGPIAGLTYGTARHGWREEFYRLLGGQWSAIDCFSPMRGKDFQSECKSLPCLASVLEKEQALERPLGVIARDFHDVTKRDVMVVNFLGAERVSIGTVWEMGVAYSHRKPVIVVMEPTGNVHDHVFCTHSAGYVVPTLEEAALIVQSILMAGV